MIPYILECIAFQLVFLIIYDFFLKRETFFQWNRTYLIGTYILSMVLPWVKIEALKNAIPQQYYIYPEYLWGANDAIVAVSEESSFTISWEYLLLFGGMVFAALLFGFKMLQIQRLRKNGEVYFFNDFTKIIISNSNAAFSFFKSVFMGDKILESEHENIIQHELVHIRQRHSCDLLFFELMRILGWFNPLVYVYQQRISELHEFIADAQVAKSNKKEQYQLLLSKVFQTQNISFINQFFKTSLIKKRIIMLQKTKSNKVWKLKYLALVPMVVGMLFYTSCQDEFGTDSVETITVNDIEHLTESEESNVFTKVIDHSVGNKDWILKVKDDNSIITFSQAPEGSSISGPDGIQLNAKMHIESSVLEDDFSLFEKNLIGIKTSFNGNTINVSEIVPFAIVEEAPIFPGCENAEDPRECFQKSMQKHIVKNFRYPQEAQEKGIQGRVNIMFTIDTEGNISDIRKRGPDKLLENEAVRIISKLPNLKPGVQRGEKVNVPFSIPITFKLQGSGSNQNALDPEYEKLKNKQLSDLPNKIQMEYKSAVPFATVEHVPIFPGCEDAENPRECFQKSMQKHIVKNFRYPKEAQGKGMQGRVSIMFLIDADGNITNIAKRGPDKSLEDEAVRIISKLPRIIPGSHEGENVDVPFSIPITFKLQ